MNRFASVFFLAVISVAFIACKDSVSLGFNTQNPSPEDYELRSSLRVFLELPDTVSAEAQQSMAANVQVRIHSELLSAYDDGSGRFLLRVDSASYFADNRSVEEVDHIRRYLQTQAVQYKMGVDGEMSSVRFDEMVAWPDIGDVDIRRIFMKVQPVLPSSPLAKGDSWERQQVIANDKGKQSIVYKRFELDDVFNRDGGRIAKLKMNIRYKQKSEDEAQIMESPDFILGSGTILFDIDAGKILEGELNINGKIRVIERSRDDTIPELRVLQKISLRRLRE